MAADRAGGTGTGRGAGLAAMAAAAAWSADLLPVLNEDTRRKIARDWNVGQSGAGFLTRFRVLRSCLDQCQVHQVGGRGIGEYQIPAEDLPALNAHRWHDRGQRRVRTVMSMSDDDFPAVHV